MYLKCYKEKIKSCISQYFLISYFLCEEDEVPQWRHKNEGWGKEEWERKPLKMMDNPHFYDVTGWIYEQLCPWQALLVLNQPTKN